MRIEEVIGVAGTFARLVADGRARLGLTQEEMAYQLGVSQATIHNWERDRLAGMTPQRMTRLARLLEVEPVDIAEAMGYPIKERKSAKRAAGTLPDEITLMRGLSLLVDRLSCAQDEAVLAWLSEYYGAAVAATARKSLSARRRTA